MKPAVEFEESEVVDDVPESAILTVQRPPRYGTIEGLDDEELADPEELERQVYVQEFAPVLALPVRGRSSGIHPDVDESGGVEWGAFGTVDFARTMPEFDRARYKAEKLREQLADLLIIVGIVSERLPGRAKYRVLKYVQKGWLELDEIASEDMRALAKLYLRARKLQQDIAELKELSHRRRQARTEALWARLG